jgi:subtilase family serine protease
MKTFLAFSLLIQLLVGSFTLTTSKKIEGEVVTKVQENIFVIKAPRKLKGAELEVVAANGYVISSQKLTHRKHVIDFNKVATGTYKIKIKKGATNQEFAFIKK